MRLILASASPRRRELLRSLGLHPEVCPVPLDETPLPGEPPDAMVVRLASAKADLAVHRLLAGEASSSPALVLAADTTVAVDGRVLGKPADPADAMGMLRLLSGRDHSVFTAMALRIADPASIAASDVCETRVTFMRMSDADIEAYVATGEPMDKAGAYGIQGGAGRFIARVEGSHSNVVGLPLERLGPLLARLGLTPDDLRER